MILNSNKIESSKNLPHSELIFHLANVFNILKKEITEDVVSSVICVIDSKLINQKNEESVKLLNTSELSIFLGVSKSTIIKLREQGLPIIKFGDNIRFDKKDVLKFIQNIE